MTDLSWLQLALLWLVVAGAYAVFGIAGFGSALVAGPVMTQVIPLSRIVPTLALLDFVVAVANFVRDGRRADRRELARLIPLMIVGSGVGAMILLNTRPDVLLLLLGLFVTAYALYSLIGRRPPRRHAAWLVVPFGLVGGVFSALFGSGGFLYAIYLGGRLEDKEQFRITQSTLIGLSTMTRIVLFLLAGVYHEAEILRMALLLMPAALAGLWLGRRVTLRLSREQFTRVMNIIVLASGIALLVRYALSLS